MSLGALGIVYGDIGTSPLYSLRECFHGAHGVPPTHANVLKYHVYVLRMDNRGEGGILALMGLVHKESGKQTGFRRLIVPLGLFGAALLYGDGIITPAISVLSAVEGLEVATPAFTSSRPRLACSR